MGVGVEPVYCGGIGADGQFVGVAAAQWLCPSGEPDTGSFDAACFDLKQKSQNRECHIVQIDHESILCNWKVRVSTKLWPSFVKLMENVISGTDAVVH